MVSGNHYNHVDDAHVPVRGEQRTESDRPTTTVRDEPDRTVSERGEEAAADGGRDGVFSLIPRGQRRERAFWKRERSCARLPSGARPTAFLPPSESSLHSSYRLLSLPPLCIAVRPLLFSTLIPLNPSPTPHAGRPAPPVSRSGPNFSLERRLNTRLCHLPRPLNLAALSLSFSLSSPFFFSCLSSLFSSFERTTCDSTNMIKKRSLFASRVSGPIVPFVISATQASGNANAIIPINRIPNAIIN